MKNRNILFHGIAWVVFIVYEVSTILIVTGHIASLTDYVTHYILNISLFYFNALVLIRGLDKTVKRYFTLAYGIIFEMVAYIALNYFLNAILNSFNFEITRPINPVRSFLIASCWRCLYFIGLSSVYGLYRNIIDYKDKIIQLKNTQLIKEKTQLTLEKKLLNSQNAYLQAQINPHLLFNTLSFIYNSVYKKSSIAGDAVILLSDIMRYSISETDEDGKVLLSDEISNIEKLVRLNQIRFDNNLKLLLKLNGDFCDYKILPLVLLTFSENVFKYGELQDDNNYAVIEIGENNNEFYFISKNKKRGNISELQGSGLGIKNLKNRLDFSYPNQYHLEIDDSQNFYSINLSINIEYLCLAAI